MIDARSIGTSTGMRNRDTAYRVPSGSPSTDSANRGVEQGSHGLVARGIDGPIRTTRAPEAGVGTPNVESADPPGDAGECLGVQDPILLPVPGRTARATESLYERRVGPVDVFVLDSNDLEEEGQMEWLSTALASSSAPWQVLVFHHPVYSCGKHGSTPRVQRELLPIVASQGVDLVVNGHDHDYQRFPPVNGTTVRPLWRRRGDTLPRRRLPSRHARPGRMERRRSRLPLHLGDPDRTRRNGGIGEWNGPRYLPAATIRVTSNLRWSDSPRLGPGRSC